jgi:hypothetical protein
MIDLVAITNGIIHLLAADATVAALKAQHVYGPISTATVQTASLAFGVGLDREPEEGSFYRTVGHAYSRQIRFYVWAWSKNKSQELADTDLLNLLEAIKIYLRDVDHRTLGGNMLDIAIGDTDYQPGELQPGLFCSTAVFNLICTFGAALL